MPSLENLPSPISIWHRPQMPRPPQTESRSTPSLRAASSTVVPSGKRPRLPDGAKKISGLAMVTHRAEFPSPRLRRGGGGGGGARRGATPPPPVGGGGGWGGGAGRGGGGLPPPPNPPPPRGGEANPVETILISPLLPFTDPRLKPGPGGARAARRRRVRPRPAA